MVEPVERAVAGQRLSAPESFGVSTLEPGQRPPTMPPGRQVSIRVQLLDDTTEVFNISQRAPAKALFDLVCAHLNLAEGDYFSLEYQDQRKMMVWLDLLKPILKQIRRPKNTILRFVVKFFPPDHTQLLEELTRYLFALQIKHDLACGRLTCNDSSAALLISHIIQSEIGDFDEVQSFQHLLHNKYIPDQDVLMDKITEYHRKHVGQTPAESDYQLLEIARRLEMYGVRLHPAKDREGTKLSLAVSHTGVLVFQGHTKINAFNWSKVRKLSFKRKRFLIKLRPDLNQSVYQDTLEFIMASRDCCKIFWKICVEYHAFFRLFEEPRPKPKPVLFTRGSSFRFSGRTQKQVIDYVKDSEFKKIPFERKHSKIISTSSLTPQERKRTQVPKESASADLTDSPLRLTLQAPVDNPSVTSGNLNGHRDGSRPEDQGLLTSATRNQDHQIPGPASRAAKGSSSSIPFIDCSDIDSEHEARASHTHHNDEGEPLGVRGQRADTNGGGDRVYQSLQQEQQQGLVGRNRYREPRQLGNNREVTDDELSNTRSLNGGSLHGHSPLHSTLLDEIFHGGNRRALQDQRSQGYLSGARSVGSSPVVNSFHQRTHSLSHTPGEPNGHVPRSSHWNDGGHSFSRRPGSTPLFGLLAGEVPHQYGSYSPIGSRSPHLAKLQNNLCNRSDTDPFILSQLTFTPVSQVDRAVTSSNGYNQLTIPGQARANEVQRLCGRHGEHGKSPFPQMIDGSASSGTDTSDTESDTGSSSFGNQPLMYGNPAAVSSSPKVGSSHVPRSKFLELDDAEQGFNFSAAEPGARVFSC